MPLSQNDPSLDYDGSWADASKDWPAISFSDEKRAKEAFIHTWRDVKIPYGSYVLVGNTLRLETEAFKQRVEVFLAASQSLTSSVRIDVINVLRDEATRIAREHGFHDPDPGVPARVALIHSEASELLEDHRSGKLPNEVWYEGIRGEDMPGKPCGIPSELADIIIRCLDFAGFYDIDIGRVVMEKMRYNETRPFKHGRKL